MFPASRRRKVPCASSSASSTTPIHGPRLTLPTATKSSLVGWNGCLWVPSFSSTSATVGRRGRWSQSCWHAWPQRVLGRCRRFDPFGEGQGARIACGAKASLAFGFDSSPFLFGMLCSLCKLLWAHFSTKLDCPMTTIVKHKTQLVVPASIQRRAGIKAGAAPRV